MGARWQRYRDYDVATSGAAALAAFSLVTCAPIVRLASAWPPRFAARMGLAHIVTDGDWSVPWDRYASAPGHYQTEALAALATAVAFLGAGCLVIALFSLALHTVGRLLHQWRGLSIRAALGASLADLFAASSGNQLRAALAGAAAGSALGCAEVAMLWRAWPRLFAPGGSPWPAVAGGALLGVVAPALLTAAAGAPLVVYLQRRAASVGDLHGRQVTERGSLLAAQSALAVLQLAGLLVVVYGGALLVRGSTLLDPARPVPYDDSAAIAPLRIADPRATGAAGAAARRGIYQRLVAASRSGDTPLVAIATPGTWEGFGREISVSAFCGDCLPPEPGGVNSPVNTAEVRASAISPGALGLMAVPVERGREFRPGDDAAHERVIVLSDMAAAALFPFADPLGRLVTVAGASGAPYRVVGVARARAVDGLGAGWAPSLAWFSLLQNPAPDVDYVARAGARARLAAAGWPASAAAVRAGPVSALAGRLRDADAPLSWFGAVAAALALAGLAVATAALVMVMGATVDNRRTEIAIRLALGARRRHLWGWVGRRSLRLTLAGCLAGVSVARLAGFILRRHVSGIEADDLLLLGALVGWFGGLALLASLQPARRAMRVEPAAAWSEIR